MTHEANVFCKTCNKIDSDTDFKYYDIDLIDFLKLFKKCGYIFEKNIYCIFLQINSYPCLLDFLFEHITHELYVRSEHHPNYPDIRL